MIYYDSQRWWTLMRLQGSVFPAALLRALIPASVAYFARFQIEMSGLTMESIRIFGASNVYSGFTFVLGFSILFRTSEAYSRYWTSATSAHQMGSEWADACASLISFVQSSPKPKEIRDEFCHKVVRLFSLLHAMALEDIASLEDERFPLLDVQGFKGKSLAPLAHDVQGHAKVQTVMCWVKSCIVEGLNDGIVSVAPPILTRVFQELSQGLKNYRGAQQVVMWPLPFPYTQMNCLLLLVYSIFTPLITATWEEPPWICAVATLVSVTCLSGLDLIGSELENPFGEDPNDLPCFDMQHAFNQSLLCLMSAATWAVPQLEKGYRTHEAMQNNASSPIPPSLRREKSSVAQVLHLHTNRPKLQKHVSFASWNSKSLGVESVARMEDYLGIDRKARSTGTITIEVGTEAVDRSPETSHPVSPNDLLARARAESSPTVDECGPNAASSTKCDAEVSESLQDSVLANLAVQLHADMERQLSVIETLLAEVKTIAQCAALPVPTAGEFRNSSCVPQQRSAEQASVATYGCSNISNKKISDLVQASTFPSGLVAEVLSPQTHHSVDRTSHI